MDSLILKTIIIGIFLILRKPEHPVEFPIFDLLTFHMGRMFTEQFPELRSKFECVTIADARNEDEMWDIFENIYSRINDNDEIIFSKGVIDE